ncbi:family 43 glycosylhydrolase [Sphingomonas sp. RP10(2022)]|uniref:Family 43 glycosylhydrolase n=1 Tax=Sphingomonas liriopis TaxID=2949094 RepID=A0A9X2HP86_9SPHN|nr:family 43 glycosylhydrolase [Sphingomonas liriopis]MCP3734633.1 family 43 glycosylhydrolase [Sphingomonas liriopis]
MKRAAIAMLVALSSQGAPAQTIHNDVFWKDTSGTPIYSQGGGMLKVGRRYYWYGAKYEEAVAYARQPAVHAANPHFSAVTVYSSENLVDWRFEGNAITVGAAGQRFARDAWMGRLGVVYNARTRKYVLVSQYAGKETGPGIVFATSDTPAGPFVFARHQAVVDGVATRTPGDQTVFVDDDGNPYLIFSGSGDRRSLYVAPLDGPDYLHVGPATRVYDVPGGGREGNAMFKHGGLYYFCSSELHGWNASRSYYMTARAITGPYGPERSLQGTEADFSHVSQNGFFIPVQGTEATTILYAGDRWSDFAGNGIGYNVWVPLSFEGDVPHFRSLSAIDLDTRRGRWTVGAANNYVLNPSFEADRVPQTGVAGWVTSWTNLKGAAPIVNTLGGRTGRWALTLAPTAAAMGSAVQTITLPNGRYALRAWVKSTGGQAVARLFATGYGGATIARDLMQADRWTEITLPSIEVTNQHLQIGAYVESTDRQALVVDDFQLVGTDP